MTSLGKALRTGIAALTCGVAMVWGLAGCVQYASSDPGVSSDPEVRHPIVLATAPAMLDVYPINGGLDKRSVSELRAFATKYRRFGTGEILIVTGAGGVASRQAIDQIRHALLEAGVGARVAVTQDPLQDGIGAPPIRVAFMALKAEVPTSCGQWPGDLASGSSLEGWKNEAWENFGCATQATLAAQVDDPRDFVQARPLGPSDVAMRMRAIENVRKGQDPGTDWKTNITPIGGSGTSN